MDEAGPDTQTRGHEAAHIPTLTLDTYPFILPASEPGFVDPVLLLGHRVLAGSAGVDRGASVNVLLVAEPPAGLSRDPVDEEALGLFLPDRPPARPPAPGRAVEAAGKVVVSVEDAEAVTYWLPGTAGAAVTKLTLDMDTRAVHQITAPRSVM